MGIIQASESNFLFRISLFWCLISLTLQHLWSRQLTAVSSISASKNDLHIGLVLCPITHAANPLWHVSFICITRSSCWLIMLTRFGVICELGCTAGSISIILFAGICINGCQGMVSQCEWAMGVGMGAKRVVSGIGTRTHIRYGETHNVYTTGRCGQILF